MKTENYTKEQLTKYNKAALVDLLLSQQQMLEQQAKQLEVLNHNIELLLEQNKISKQNQFGRSSEKIELVEQLSMCFNEAEVTIENKYVVDSVPSKSETGKGFHLLPQSGTISESIPRG